MKKFNFVLLPVMIKQCISAKRTFVHIPYHKHYEFTINFMQEKGYLKYFRLNNELLVFPKYLPDGASVLQILESVSKPSARQYIKVRQMYSMGVRRGLDMTHYIISTRQGLMSLRDAYKLKVGGELIYKIC